MQNIYEAKVHNRLKWSKTIIKTLYQYYSKYPYFSLIEELIISEIENKNITHLVDLNCKIILKICKNIECNTDFKNDYDYEFLGKKSEKLKNICKYFKTSNYISPIGSREYIEKESFFKNNNIDVQYLHINNEIQYNQLNNNKFQDNLSILDVIANIGLEGTIEYINRKYKLI